MINGVVVGDERFRGVRNVSNCALVINPALE